MTSKLGAYVVKREVSIDSYFSVPTDLAAEMKHWEEFVSGEGYAVTLKTKTETVSTSLEQDEGHPLVFIRGSGDGQLFFRVLGVTLYALAAHSDSVWPRVIRWNPQPVAQA